MNKLQLSVSMCVYGGDNAIYFREALESVYGQTRKPDEVVLVVDGPVTSEINQVISDYETQNDMKVFRLEKNMGHGIARATGLKNCTYDYIAIADADDINRKDRFEKQMAMFEKDPSLSAISSGCYHFVDSIDNILNEEKLPVTEKEISKYIKKRCPLCQASAVFKKTDVVTVGGYIDWYCAEDYYLWIRLYENGYKLANSPESLLYVRSDEDQMNRRGGYRYYKSMRDLFVYMYKHKIINLPNLIYNVSTRFVLQVLMTPSMRGFIRKHIL